MTIHTPSRASGAALSAATTVTIEFKRRGRTRVERTRAAAGRLIASEHPRP